MYTCIMYTCDGCGSQVPYENWQPIEFNWHWCRDCVTRRFDEIPYHARFNARRFRDRDYEVTPSLLERLFIWIHKMKLRMGQ